LSLPLVDIVEIAEKPGYLLRFGEVYLQVSYFVTNGSEIRAAPESRILSDFIKPEFYPIIRCNADKIGILSEGMIKSIEIFLNRPAKNGMDGFLY
jgi:hypothetical protein